MTALHNRPDTPGGVAGTTPTTVPTGVTAVPATATVPPAPVAVETTREKAVRYTFAGLRFALGWVFLWAFLDKLFGFGFATPEARAWVNGGQPTAGFLKGVEGPFAGFYNGMAGAAWADWLFMAALLGVGVALFAGIGLRIAAIAGGLLMVMMWTAALPLDNNPFMDDHLIYAGLLVLIALAKAGDTLGLGRWWATIPLVKRAPILK